MTQNQKTIALVSFVLLIAGGVGYFYFRKKTVPLEGIDQADKAELSKIQMV
jgi:hypothetical protein